MLVESLENISNSAFPFELRMRLQSFIEDRLIFISSQSAFISYKNDLIFVTRLLDPSIITNFDQNSPNIAAYPLARTSCVLKTSHLSECGHLKCSCIKQYGNLSNFVSNGNVLALYFTSNLIVTYKLTWLPIRDSSDDIGLDLTKNLEFKAKRAALTCIALDDSGDYLACSYFDSTTLVYNSDNVYRKFNVKDAVSLMRFHDACLFCSSNQGDIYIYYLAESVIKLFQGHNSNISDLCFLSFNNTSGFLSSSFDSIVNLYSMDRNISLESSKCDHQVPLKQFLFSNPVIGITVLNTELYEKNFDTKSPWLLLAVTESYSFELIDPITTITLKKVTSGSNSAKRVFFCNNFFVVFTSSFELEFYDIKTFDLLYGMCCNFDKCYYARIPPTNFVTENLDCPFLLVLNGDEKVRLVSTSGYNMQITLYNHPDVVLTADMLGEFIATGSKDGTLIIYNLIQRNKINTICASQNSIVSIVLFKQTGSVNFVTADLENIVKIWSNDGTLLHITVAHSKTVNHIAISPNHKIIATASSDKIVKLFNNKLELLGSCKGHSKSVNHSIFIEKDMLLVTASNDTLVKCWNVKSFECIKTFQGHDNPVLVITQLDDYYIASADVTGIIKIWNLRNSLCAHTLQPHANKIWYMGLHSRFLVTCSEDDSIILWKYTENANTIPPSKERIRDQTEIDSLLASKNYVNALFLGIKLDMPSKALEIVTKFSEFIIFNQFSDDNSSTDCFVGSSLIKPLLNKIIKTRGSSEFANLLSCLCHLIRVCISNAKLSNIGNLFLSELLKHCNFDDLNLVSGHLQLGDLALLQSKHYNRIFHMAEKAWLLDLLVLDCGDLQVSKTMHHLNR